MLVQDRCRELGQQGRGLFSSSCCSAASWLPHWDFLVLSFVILSLYVARLVTELASPAGLSMTGPSLLSDSARLLQQPSHT